MFCDIDPETFCVTPETVRAALTPRTKAVIVVHLFGNVAPVAEIAALGVPVVEDAAQAAGSRSAAGRPGALGTIATFSFFPSKNLGCFGDGGAVTTNDAALAERVRMLRFHGSKDKSTFELVGHNSRLDELQAAVLRVQLPHLDELVGRPPRGRRARTSAPGSASSSSCRGRPPERTPRGISTSCATRCPTTWPPRWARPASAARRTTGCPRTASRRCANGAPTLKLPGTEEAARSALAIPISPVLGEDQANEVTAAVRAAP